MGNAIMMSGDMYEGLREIKGIYKPTVDTQPNNAVIKMQMPDISKILFLYLRHLSDYPPGTINAVLQSYSLINFGLDGSDSAGTGSGYNLWNSHGRFLNSSGVVQTQTYGNVYGGWGTTETLLKLGCTGGVWFLAGHEYEWRVIYKEE